MKEHHYKVLRKWYRFREKKVYAVPTIRWVLTLIHKEFLQMRKQWQQKKHSWKPIITANHVRFIIEKTLTPEEQLRIHSAVARVLSSRTFWDSSEEESLQSSEESVSSRESSDRGSLQSESDSESDHSR